MKILFNKLLVIVVVAILFSACAFDQAVSKPDTALNVKEMSDPVDDHQDSDEIVSTNPPPPILKGEDRSNDKLCIKNVERSNKYGFNLLKKFDLILQECFGQPKTKWGKLIHKQAVILGLSKYGAEKLREQKKQGNEEAELAAANAALLLVRIKNAQTKLEFTHAKILTEPSLLSDDEYFDYQLYGDNAIVEDKEISRVDIFNIARIAFEPAKRQARGIVRRIAQDVSSGGRTLLSRDRWKRIFKTARGVVNTTERAEAFLASAKLIIKKVESCKDGSDRCYSKRSDACADNLFSDPGCFENDPVIPGQKPFHEAVWDSHDRNIEKTKKQLRDIVENIND
jgi:hypothetical protein